MFIRHLTIINTSYLYLKGKSTRYRDIRGKDFPRQNLNTARSHERMARVLPTKKVVIIFVKEIFWRSSNLETVHFLCKRGDMQWRKYPNCNFSNIQSVDVSTKISSTGILYSRHKIIFGCHTCYFTLTWTS